MANLIESITRAGEIAGAISAVVGLLALILFKPLSKRYRKRKETQEEARKAEELMRAAAERERREFEKTVLETLKSIADDVAELQRDRLCQAHEFYTKQGWCPPSKKKELCDWHNAYTSKGRNHLTEHYEDDILELPDFPADEKEDAICRSLPS